MNIPRPEHPNPQRVRERWENLNGEWDFTVDMSKSGRWRDLKLGTEGYDRKITVPFCPESELSGVGITDFMPAVWYSRKIEISATDLTGRVLLNIGACDWFCEVYVNGISCGTHKGGYSSFRFDITDKLTEGENTLVIYAEDDTRSGIQGSGKQSMWHASHGCYYTRTTGIWQTVWLEFVPRDYIKSFYVTADTDNSIAVITGTTVGCGKVCATALYEGKEVGSACTTS
ncbi:MAG: beta-galactosidase, partial [Clostridia bacterium]|nr:beta-galactosidase [Clostridia bacterium]